MKSLKINNHDLVLCVRCDFLTPEKAIDRFRHNIREQEQASRIKYLRGDSFANKYLILKDFNSNMLELSSKDIKYRTKDYIKSFLNTHLEIFKADYSSQTYTTKNGKVTKKAWRKDMVPFSEIVISFGTSRAKANKEGLNTKEVNIINACWIYK